MAKLRRLQEQVPSGIVGTTDQLRPFESETHFSSSARAELLQETIPPMGASGPQPRPGSPNLPEPVAVEEQYQPSERRAFATTTTPAYYDLITQNPKQILIESETVDHFVDFNQQITSDSPKVFASTTLTVTGKGVTRLWFQAVSGTGTIRILVTAR